MDQLGVVALHEQRLVTVALEQSAQLLVRDPREDRWVGDLVAVQMQHGQHGAVARWIHELVRVPARRERTGLGLTVADHTEREQIRGVQNGAVGMQERVTELPALVDRARRLGSYVRRDAPREGELPKQTADSLLVLADPRVDLRVGALEVDVRDQPWAAMARTGHVDRVQVALPDDSVHVRVEQVEPGRGAPVAEQARLHMLERERLVQ